MKQRILFAIIMGSITTCLASLVVVIVNKGFFTGFMGIWLKSWAMSFIVAVPFIIIVGPKIQYMVEYILRQKRGGNEKIKTGPRGRSGENLQ